ncbi:MAG: hypothetical protein ACLUD2_06655 [Clostridium sp.]
MQRKAPARQPVCDRGHDHSGAGDATVAGNSISGNYAGYTGYYNYFNVGAYASDGMGAVQRGLWYASQSGSYGRPWTTPESSIAGGAQFYGTNYVKAGQDTLYLKSTMSRAPTYISTST